MQLSLFLLRPFLFLLFGAHCLLSSNSYSPPIKSHTFKQEMTRGLPHGLQLSNESSRRSNRTTRISRDVGFAVATAMLSLQMSMISPAWSADGADLTRGATLFDANCAGCHRGGMNFIKEKKTLQKAALEKFLSLDQPKVQDMVQNKMPHSMLPMKKEFDDKDYYDVTSYVLDQALGDKW